MDNHSTLLLEIVAERGPDFRNPLKQSKLNADEQSAYVQNARQ